MNEPMKKLVDVRCYRPFRIGHSSFAGICKGIVLDTNGILICLENKAKVSEILSNGTTVPLDFSNYDQVNDGTVNVSNKPVENDVHAHVEPVVEDITVSSIRKVNNPTPPVEKKVEVVTQPVETKKEEVSKPAEETKEVVKPVETKVETKTNNKNDNKNKK
jgi:hypothetical protein